MAALPKVPHIKLGSQGLHVSALGLGCMGMSSAYGAPKPEQDMIDLIHQAVDRGVTFLDTSNLYGPYTNELLLGKAIKGIRNKVQLATKFGVEFDGAGGNNIRGDPPYVRSCCEESLKRLQVDYIDLYYQHRIDNKVPVEDTIGEMKKLVAEGKVKYLGLSEASASTIRRAHAVHPITAVQIEWSLWSRDVEEEIVPTCRELGIGIVPYSPLGRGFFTAGAKLLENLSSTDFRKVAQPRMQGENLDHNNLLFENLARVAARKGCTPGQLALAWVQHQGKDVASIPGTTKLTNLEENIGALAVHLTQQDIDEIEALFPPNIARGDRYLPNLRTYLQSDTPPLT